MSELEELKSKRKFMLERISDMNKRINTLELNNYFKKSGVRVGSVVQVRDDTYTVTKIKYPGSDTPSLTGKKHKLNGEPSKRESYIPQGFANKMTVLVS